MVTSNTYRRIFYSAIILFWVVTTGLLVNKHLGNYKMPVVSIQNPAIPEDLFEEQWLGIYLKGEKVGYSSRNMEERKNGYGITESLKMKIKMMEAEKNIETLINADLDSNLKLLSFNFRLRSDLDMDVTGNVEGNNLIVNIKTGVDKSTQTIRLGKEPYLSISALSNILKDGLKKGRKISMSVFDPSVMSMGEMNLEVLEKVSLMSMGRMQEAYKLKGELKGVEFAIWVTEKGEVLKEESSLGLVLIKERKEDAMKVGSPSIDLIAQTAVPFNIKLKPGTDYLKVRLSGVDLKGFELDGGRQRLTGDVVEIKKEVIPPHPPLSKGGQRGDIVGSGVSDEYLKETMFIQSKDPQVVSLSNNIVKDEKDAVRASKLLYEWVYENIEKVPTMSVPMSTEVLKAKRGDCNEHATLFTALSRAAGIPARIAIGLTYKDGFFYYHAWPEIFSGRWIAVDPTLGQFPADAAHIRLITGDIDRQVQLLPVIGKIKIEGLEHK